MLLRLLLVAISVIGLASPLQAAPQAKIAFWNSQRKGANCFNTRPEPQWFADARAAGLQWVRLAYDKWPSRQKDFLLGDADSFTRLVPEDLDLLIQALDMARAEGIKVVITPLSLPGARWAQHNDGKQDLRLWTDKRYWTQAAAFWRQLALALREHPAVIGYNLLNEPTPEMGTGLPEAGDPGRYADWYKRHQGTSHDLPAFYRGVITAIREVDSQTPIMLDSGWYAQPAAFSHWSRLSDDKLLYAFHMYEPYDFTNHKNFKSAKPYVYPGPIPYADQIVNWNTGQMEKHISPFLGWAKAQKLPASRLVAAEFGCYRRNPGCAAYLGDLVKLFNAQAIHWAFYSFREDEWDGYDYELGTGPLPAGYWQARETGTPVPRNPANPLFQVLRSQF